ncbi:MAG: hypothetical protein ACLPN1_03555 [Dissulfurispiraceae bacterium]
MKWIVCHTGERERVRQQMKQQADSIVKEACEVMSAWVVKADCKVMSILPRSQMQSSNPPERAERI